MKVESIKGSVYEKESGESEK